MEINHTEIDPFYHLKILVGSLIVFEEDLYYFLEVWISTTM